MFRAPDLRMERRRLCFLFGHLERWDMRPCVAWEWSQNPGVDWVLKRGILILFQVGGFRMAGSVFSGSWLFFTCFTYVYMIIFTATWCFCLGLPKISAWNCYYSSQRSCVVWRTFTFWWLNFWSESWWLIGQLLRCSCPTKPPRFNPVRTVVLPFRSHVPNNGTGVFTY